MSDFKVGDTIYHHFSTRAFATGIPTTLAGTPVAEAYEEANVTGLTAGVSLTIDHAETGHHLLTIVATGGNSFETGKSYGVSLTAGTVDSVSVVGEVIFNFSLEKSPSAQDLANGTDGLTALKTGIDGIPTTAEFEARTIVSASYFDPAADTVGTVTTVTNQLSAATVANQVWDTDATGRQTAGTFGQAIGDPGANTETIYDAVVTDAAGTNIAADIIVIESQTDDIGIAGAGLTAINLPNQTMDIVGDITGNLSGSVGSVTADVGITATAVNLIWDEAMTETTGAPSVTASFREALKWIFALSRNKILQTSTTTTLRNDADGGDLATSTVADDATTYTRGEWST